MNIYMEKAIKEAKKAYYKDEVPVGAVIVYNNKIISKAHNLKEKKKNSLFHAEIIAINKACKKMKNWRLDECEIYVTLEPCTMCAGAIVESRIKKVYCAAEKTNDCSIEYLKKCGLTVKTGIYKEESLLLLQKFFKKKR